jgi:chromosomal replication initiator protein
MSSLQAAPITLEYTRSCLQGYLQVEEPTASCESIASGVAKFFDVKMSDMKGPRRTKQIVMPRQIAMYLARKHTGLSLPEIGRRFGGRDHTTVIHAVKKVKARMQEDSYRTKVELVARSVGLPTDPPT